MPNSAADDLHLIHEAQAGSREAFKKLVLKYERRVLALTSRMLDNREDARDAAQEVFIRIYRFLPRFRIENKFFTWLYKITVNVCYDYLKREGRFVTVPLTERVEILENHSLDQTDFRDRILQIIDRLSTAQKTAFLLKEMEGFSANEIAKILGCPAGTVRSHLFFARKTLKEIIEKEYPEYLEGRTP